MSYGRSDNSDNRQFARPDSESSKQSVALDVGNSTEPAAGPDALDMAIRYAGLGWPVGWLNRPRADGSCTCGNRDPDHQVGKHPRDRHGFKDFTRNEGLIRVRRDEHPDSNLGIRTGQASGVVLIDIDLPK